MKDLPEADGMGLDDLAERLNDLLSEVNAAVEKGKQIEANLKALADQRNKFAKSSREYQELDARIRTMTVDIIKTVFCGRCGRLDNASSGCYFAGNSRE